MVVIITLLDAFVPKILLEIRHHQLCILPLQHPQVNSVGYKCETQIMDSRLVITGRRKLRLCPEAVKYSVNRGIP